MLLSRCLSRWLLAPRKKRPTLLLTLPVLPVKLLRPLAMLQAMPLLLLVMLLPLLAMPLLAPPPTLLPLQAMPPLLLATLLRPLAKLPKTQRLLLSN